MEDKMSKENTTIYIILGLLTHEDLSGYDIKKRIDQVIGNFWSAGYGQIYPTLKQVEAQGLVTKRATDELKGHDRIVYSITPSGREKLTEWLMLPEEKEYVKYEMLLKLFFGSLMPEQNTLKMIDNFKNRSMDNLKNITGFKANLEEVLKQSDDHLYFYLTVLFGEHIYRAYSEWADEARELLSKPRNNL
jgi:DNA-binding PadR family transcriptional regulator